MAEDLEAAVRLLVPTLGYSGCLEDFSNASLIALRDELDRLPGLLPRLYRTWSLKAHPDKGGNEETFKRVTEAKDNLPRLLSRRIEEMEGQKHAETQRRMAERIRERRRVQAVEQGEAKAREHGKRAVGEALQHWMGATRVERRVYKKACEAGRRAMMRWMRMLHRPSQQERQCTALVERDAGTSEVKSAQACGQEMSRGSSFRKEAERSKAAQIPQAGARCETMEQLQHLRREAALERPKTAPDRSQSRPSQAASREPYRPRRNRQGSDKQSSSWAQNIFSFLNNLITGMASKKQENASEKDLEDLIVPALQSLLHGTAADGKQQDVRDLLSNLGDHVQFMEDKDSRTTLCLRHTYELLYNFVHSLPSPHALPPPSADVNANDDHHRLPRVMSYRPKSRQVHQIKTALVNLSSSAALEPDTLQELDRAGSEWVRVLDELTSSCELLRLEGPDARGREQGQGDQLLDVDARCMQWDDAYASMREMEDESCVRVHMEGMIGLVRRISEKGVKARVQEEARRHEARAMELVKDVKGWLETIQGDIIEDGDRKEAKGSSTSAATGSRGCGIVL
ncbi:hypothetical protein GUITHDRAFT_105401 [Guillardia theta CCMP2712]|uniref:J domain-containing protein n=1 Tax=Guillardia theta (strain CCMP2712) TaxID=905079 RepID=L1JJU3_GUITC|nr:hypothetical protein GUITHDRAFT_105401 [Guillardia theta CCMP2712]EKX48773.1 hypothetical protein GUITHDRAFT_105401 [Guillardia theta CCMP2712]|eukprot:XP_005835753.1 hypothetical protein GUITHDRAFT_105401 [Guillardia theta CCMP2712]